MTAAVADLVEPVSSILRHLEWRASVREFTSAALDEEAIDTVLRGALRAPSSFNFQPYSIVVVRQPATLAALAELAGCQEHVRLAPVLLMFCADLARVRRWCGFDPGADFTTDLDLLVACVTDTAMAGMCASLVAESQGLGTVMVGGVRNDPERVAGLLALPPGLLAAFALCLGHPASRPAPRPRLGKRLCVHKERFDPDVAADATEYSPAELSMPDGGIVAPKAAAAWADQLAKGAHRARRMAARAVGSTLPAHPEGTSPCAESMAAWAPADRQVGCAPLPN
jgi:nitroreductase